MSAPMTTARGRRRDTGRHAARPALVLAAAVSLTATGCSASPGGSPAPAPTTVASPGASASAPAATDRAMETAPATGSPGETVTLDSAGGLIRVTAPATWTRRASGDPAEAAGNLEDHLAMESAEGPVFIRMLAKDTLSERTFVSELLAEGRENGMTCKEVVVGLALAGATDEVPTTSVECKGKGSTRLASRVETTNTTTLFLMQGKSVDGPLDPVMQALVHNTQLGTPPSVSDSPSGSSS